ncbi:MAG TPA: DUF4123 domain-containing protein [Thermoanaerobaculia bacterium]|nr:DUF4123 domain-containing protein [Thermoanaerobaculia bacterium]
MSEHLRILPVTLADLQQLAGEQRLYAVLDACDAPAIQAKVGELGSSRALCLYRGEVAPEILEVAPYLARVDEALFQWLTETVWSEPWGIFVVAKLEPEAVRKHLRKFLMVKDPDGEAMYFRYYDPRVLPTFLGSCNRQELDSFFGGLAAFGCAAEKDSGAGLLFQKSHLA